jgi:D-alanine-D-alanine ligase
VLGAIDRDHWNVVAVGITRDGRWTAVSDDPATWELRDGHMPHVSDDGETVMPPASASSQEWRRVGEGGQILPYAHVDVVFPLLHGAWGEDGTVQGALELVDVRYVGSGVLASALGMDKEFMKVAFRAAGLPVTPDVVVRGIDELAARQEAIRALGLPVFVKPARAGSSMGISRVDDWGALDAAVALAAKHDPKVLIERAVAGREIETAVLDTPDGLRVSPAGEIVTQGDHAFYDFDAKYLDESGVQLLCPVELAPDVAEVVADYAARAFEAIDAEGLARVDCFVASDGTVTINEINTMPGFTPTSMYPRMWRAGGIDYPHVVATLLAGALERRVGLR